MGMIKRSPSPPEACRSQLLPDWWVPQPGSTGEDPAPAGDGMGDTGCPVQGTELEGEVRCWLPTMARLSVLHLCRARVRGQVTVPRAGGRTQCRATCTPPWVLCSVWILGSPSGRMLACEMLRAVLGGCGSS